jgi:hypothetical protein
MQGFFLSKKDAPALNRRACVKPDVCSRASYAFGESLRRALDRSNAIVQTSSSGRSIASYDDNPEYSAGAEFAMFVPVKLLISSHRKLQAFKRAGCRSERR